MQLRIYSRDMNKYFSKIYIHIPRETRRLYRDLCTRIFSSLREGRFPTADVLISETWRVSEGEKRIVFPLGALFISFRRHWRTITARRRITRISAAAERRKRHNFNLRNPPSVLSERPRNSTLTRFLLCSNALNAPVRLPISHIIRRSIDSYVDTPLRSAWKLAHDWSLFDISLWRRDRDRVCNSTRTSHAVVMLGGTGNLKI